MGIVLNLGKVFIPISQLILLYYYWPSGTHIIRKLKFKKATIATSNMCLILGPELSS